MAIEALKSYMEFYGNNNKAFLIAFEACRFKSLDLTDDELTKLHLRHIVGGRSSLTHNELLYRCEFPEPRMSRCIDEVRRFHEFQLEYQPVSLPQQQRRLRTNCRWDASTLSGDGRVAMKPTPSDDRRNSVLYDSSIYPLSTRKSR